MATRVRFPPSPTGALHLGGARTALFNWLFARGRGGEFLLRLEDTDRERSRPEHEAAIIEALKWLGLDWDGEIVRQSERAGRHAEVARGLLEAGGAYRCWATPEELAEMRAAARAEKRPPRYDRRWRGRDPGPEQEGTPFAVRLKAPLEGRLEIQDAVQGAVSLDRAEMDDMVLLRADGSPTYMLSVVVDDHDMGITHVIRGDDHLTNAFRQTTLYEALGWEPPVFAHIPLIHGPDGAKLSKRHGAVSTLEWRDAGVLPEAMRSCLLRLGWGKGDHEALSLEEMLEHFSLEGVGRAAARFDPAKLRRLNGLRIRAMDDAELAADAARRLRKSGLDVSGEGEALLRRAMPGLKTRAEDLGALAESARFYLEAPRRLEEKARAALDAAPEGLAEALRAEGAWDEAALEARLRGFAEARGLKFKEVAQPLRAACTGTLASPPIFEALALLGREEALRRLEAAGAPPGADGAA